MRSVSRAPARSFRAGRWLSWLIGLAMIAALVLVTIHVSEERALIQLVQRSNPAWLLAALPLQALTYVAESQIWRTVAHAGGATLPLATAYRLSIAKLFVDQAIPTGGIGGTMLYIKSIQHEGVRRGAALAGMAVTTFSYYSAYALCLSVALLIACIEGYLNAGVVSVAVLFMLISMALSVIVLNEAGRTPGRFSIALERIRLIQEALRLLRDADPKLARDRRVLAAAIAWQIVIVLLDAGSIWCLLHAVGVDPAPQAVYASYMFSSLFRTLGVLPGGLGTFEAASVLLLGAVGVPAAAGLSATLLFRGVSFWLPMLPGMFIAHRIVRG